MRFRFGDYSLDAGRRELRRGDALVAVEPQVFDLLLYLVQNRDRVVSKDDLLQAIWNGRIVSESTLTSRINAARRAIGDSGAQQGTIRTLARKGFRFVAPVTEGGHDAVAVKEVRPVTVLRQEVQFCTSADGTRIAYASVGEGIPLVKAANWLSHLDYDWESPVWSHLLRALAAEHRLIRYDERGNGLSDWNVHDISLEAFVRDLESVVDASGLERFALLGISQGCPVSIAYAVRYPERVSHLVLCGGYARGRNKRGSQREIEQAAALRTLMREGWGQENPAFRQVFTSLFIPGGTPEQMQWFNELQRRTTSPENAVRIRAAMNDIDVTDLLPHLTVPTLVLHCRDDAVVPFDEGRRLAGGILGARFVALQGGNHLLLEGEAASFHFLDEVRAFLRAAAGPSPTKGHAVAAAATPKQTMPAMALDAPLRSDAPDRPSIAVLPFTNLDGDPQHEYFVDGVVEDIITGLARARWLFVIARNSSFVYKRRACDVRQVGRELGVRYVLDGSIRKAGERVRIAVQLLDGASGNQVWAQRYDRELSDIFALQDEITETILGAVEPELGKLERKRATTKRPDSVDAWDLYQRGMSHLYQYTKEDLALARQFFRQATEKDPRLGPAYSGLAEARYCEGVYGFADSISDCREEALAPALRAVALDPEDAGARCTLGRAHYMRRNYEVAARELRTALQLNPSLALAHYGLGATLVFSGRSREAVPHLMTAIRLSPYDPNMGSFLVRLADAAFFAGKYEEATEWAQKALQQPNFQWSRYTVLIAALAQLGRLDEADRFLQQLKVKRPDISLSFVRETHLFGDADNLARYLGALRKAGLAEEPDASKQSTVDGRASTDGRKASRPAVADQVRRQVSVLAAEIVTPLQDLRDPDPEVGIAVVSPFVGTVRREVERCGGTVLSSTDVGIVGIFGAGRATEDHAFQACRAALAIRSAVEIGAQTHVRLSVGLDTGETLLRTIAIGETLQVEAWGAVVHMARHLAQALRRHAIACTSRMNDALLGYVTAVAMSDFDLADARPAGSYYEILGLSEARTRWQLRRARGLTPLTGRVAELAYLKDTLQRACSGSGQCVGVVGDAGIGKSRLVYEFLASTGASACRVVEIGATESSAITSFHVVKKLLRTILFSEEGDDAPPTAGKVAASIDSLGADSSLKPPVLFALDILPDDREWVSLPVSERVRRVRNAIPVLLALTAKAMPLVVVVEDLHWIDAESEAVLDRLIDSVATQRILLLMTFRPEYNRAWGSRSNYNQLRLEPLPRSDSEVFLNVLLGDDGSVRASVPLIADRTDGVPLFMEETVQALVQSGALTGSPGAYIAGSEITGLRVPPTIQSVIASRLDQLAPSERRLLQNAAIIGRDVSLGILASMAELDEETAAERAYKLQSVGLLYQSQLFPVQAFTFKHALVQKVAYDSLVIADRKLLHSRFIDALEANFPHLIDDYVERLSEHAISAERWDKAEKYLLRSAGRALQRSSHNLALSFLQKGLEILAKRPSSSDRDRVELEYQKLVGVAWMAAKGWGAEEVLAAYERAEVLCNELGDERERFIVLRGQAQYYMISRQPRAAQAISQRCAEMTKHLQDEGIAIETHHMFWTNNFFMGECEVAEKHAEDAIALYDPDRHHALTYQYSGHDPGVCSQCFSGLAAWHRGALDRASERCHGALALAERLSHPLTTSLAYWALSCLAIFRGEPESTLAWAQKQISLCDEYLLPLLRSQGEFQAGWALAQLGDVQAGVAQMEQGVEGIRATGAEMGLPYFLGLLGEALAGAGQRDRALDVLDQATASAKRNGAHFLLSEIIRIRAEVLAHSKDLNTREVEALFRSAVEIATNQNASLPALRAATGWARFLTQHRRRAQARNILEPYAPLIASLAGSKDAASAAELT